MPKTGRKELMAKQKSLGTKLFFMITFILFLSEIAIAEVPVPWGAKLIRNDTVITSSGEERTVAAYETKASKQGLINYYLKEMPNRGYNLFMNGEENLVFTKGEDLAIVALLPSGDGKTQFMVSTASTPASARANSDGGVVKCAEIPSVPVYPGARCMQSIRLKSDVIRSVAYSTDDSTDAVYNFYLLQMPRYAWQLEKERNLDDLMSEASQGEKPLAMASTQEAAMRASFRGSRGMSFTNQKGDICSINISDNPMTKGESLFNIIYENK